MKQDEGGVWAHRSSSSRDLGGIRVYGCSPGCLVLSLAASLTTPYFLAAVFLPLASGPFPLATSPVGSFEGPAWRNFTAISAISCGGRDGA